MSAYGDFHDACIVSLNFQSGAFVDDKSAMHFGGPEERVLSVVFQRQWEPKTIELQFIGLRQLHLIGWQDNYLCNILEAYLAFHDNLLPGKPHRVIVWSDIVALMLLKLEVRFKSQQIHTLCQTY